MKIVGVLLVLGALIGGGIILSETIPGYLRNKEELARRRTELSAAKNPLDKLGPNATEAQIHHAIQQSETAIALARNAEEGVARRRNESLLFGGGAVALLALGAFLVVRGSRRTSRATPLPA